MAQNKPTTDEHYIPQCYLKQFSSDGERIYQYDVLSGKQTPVPVPTKSVCYQKHLYEFRDSSGAFAYRNLIEKSFGIYEGEFAKTFRSKLIITHYLFYQRKKKHCWYSFSQR